MAELTGIQALWRSRRRRRPPVKRLQKILEECCDKNYPCHSEKECVALWDALGQTSRGRKLGSK